MWRNIASNALTFLVVVVFLFGGALIWAQNEYSASGPLDAPICLQVARGSNFNRVSQDLEEQGAISSGVIFRLGADYTEKAGQLKAGSYLVPERASMTEITDIVTKGGASTCGTEVVYRIGVNSALVQVRELDPADGRYTEVLEFNPAEPAPSEYAAFRDDMSTRFRVSLAEGVTSWQVVQELGQVDVLDGEVAGALLASTLTTAAVFIPIIAWEGEVGELLRDVAYAIAGSVIISLVVSVMVIPSLSAKFLR